MSEAARPLFVRNCNELRSDQDLRHCQRCRRARDAVRLRLHESLLQLFQPQTWDFHYGQPFDAAAEQIIFNELEKPFIRGLTLLGGDPFEPENQRALVPFLHRVRERYPDKDIWAFSGFELDKELTVDGAHPRCEVTDEMLSLIDILVDGRYVDAQRNLSLRFRGSENQRIIDMNRTRAAGHIVLWEGMNGWK